MKNNNKIKVLFQLHKDGELTGGFNQEWNNEMLSELILNLEGEVSISRSEDKLIKIFMREDDFNKTFANFE